MKYVNSNEVFTSIYKGWVRVADVLIRTDMIEAIETSMSKDAYKVIFKPSTIIPDIDIK